MSSLTKRWRKSNVLKVIAALVIGTVLVATLAPGTAQASGPSISIDRNGDGRFQVTGHGFPRNAKGKVWAAAGATTAQKTVWTRSDGTFKYDFATLNAWSTKAQAKAWVGRRYAKGAANLNSSSKSVSGSATYSSPTPTASAPAPAASAPALNNPDAETPATSTTPSAAVSSSTNQSQSTPQTTTTARPAPTTTTTAKPAAATPPASSNGFSSSASGWKLAFSDDFNGSSLDRSKWGTYDGTGNQGIGRRSSSQVSVNNGELQITGNGMTAGGLASSYKSTYGRYEVRVRMDSASKGYNDALLLWPSSENWPSDGELDMQEMFDGNTSQMGSFAHWASNNQQTGTTTKGDFSQWHTIALEWDSSSVKWFVDDKQVMQVSGAAVPHSSHFLGMQLDVANSSTHDSGAQLHVDWVKAYTR